MDINDSINEEPPIAALDDILDEDTKSTVADDELNDSSNDGFDVSEEFQLDEAGPDAEVNLDEVMSKPPPTAHLSPSDEENKENLDSSRSRNSSHSDQEKSSPFAISSLLHNKVLFKIGESSNENNGCSPSLPSQDAPRQERRRLDFSALEVNQGPPRAGNLYRRSYSMVERPPLSLNKINSSPDLCKQLKNSVDQDTSPISSRPFSSFKRPNAPLAPIDQNILANHHGDPGHPSKKVKRFASMNQHCVRPTLNLNLPRTVSTPQLDSPQSQIAKPLTMLHLSETNDANIKKACQLADQPNLTGDRTRQLILPTVPGTSGKGKNLVNINCHTLADLLKGKYDDKVASYRIIDARYEYEFKGGHIRGAENFGLWDEDAFFDEFLPKSKPPRESPPDKDDKANILIFHCEFSSARGPSIMQILRAK